MGLDREQLNALKIERNQDETHRIGWPVLVILAVAALVVLVGAWWAWRPDVIPVETTPVTEEPMTEAQAVLNASGYVTARRQATVSSKITGKIVEVHIEEGVVVSAGQVLAVLDDTLIRANLELAEAQLETARKALAETQALSREAQLNLARIAKLANQGVANQAELDRAEAEHESLTARLARQKEEIEVARRQLAMRRIELEDTVIRAPFDGVVVSKNAQPGEMISPMSAGGSFTRTGICTIVDMSSLEIEVDVNESYIQRVVAGRPVEARLDAYPQWNIPAHVIAIVPTADRQKATVEVRIGFDQLDPRVLPDMGVKVSFLGGSEPSGPATAFRFSGEAVDQDQDHDIVWVVSQGRVEKRAVRIARNDGAQAWVLSGVVAGDRLVINPPETLKDGDRVREVNR